MTPVRGEDEMDDRMRKVEGEVGVLKEWRVKTVDPHIEDAKDFAAELRDFVTTYKAESAYQKKLDAERHSSNSFKMNMLLVVGTAFLILLGILTLIVIYRQTNHSVVQRETPTVAEDATIPHLRGY